MTERYDTSPPTRIVPLFDGRAPRAVALLKKAIRLEGEASQTPDISRQADLLRSALACRRGFQTLRDELTAPTGQGD